jgi:uncharacterized protein (TIGR02300 family)
VKHRFSKNSQGFAHVAKSDLGTKRICPTTGKKFYDLNKNPVIRRGRADRADRADPAAPDPR